MAIAAPAAAPRHEFIVVDTVVAVDKRPWQGKDNVEPWIRKETPPGENSADTIVISNSCGFVDITYAGWTLPKYLRFVAEEQGVDDERSDVKRSEHEVVESMGEWCRVAGLLHERATLLGLRPWKRDRFVEFAADVHTDKHGKPFIVDRAFIDAYFLGDQVVELTDVAVYSGCAPRAELSAEDLEIMSEEGRLVTRGDEICFSHGVYLEKLLEHGGSD